MNIIRGKQQHAQKVVIYGPEGVGKSTFAAHFPDAIFIDTEGSTDNLDVARVKPLSWTELIQAVDHFIAHPDQLGTLIIDTADWAERLCIDHILAVNHWKGIEDPGYGKGYVYVSEEFGKMLDKLEQLKSNGVNVVLTAHAMLQKFEQPDEMNPYDRWTLKLSKKAAPMVKEWSDLMIFANYKTFVVTDKSGTKSKATGGTKRMMYTEHTATYDAKNRHGLKAELPFDFAEIAHIFPARSVNAPAPDTSLQEIAQTPSVAAPVAPVAAPAPTPSNITPMPVAAPVAAQTPKQAPTNVPPALAALMEPKNVSAFEIQAVVAQKGYYPAATPISKYDPQFVQGCLIGAWPQVEAMILANREKAPF